MKLHSLKASIGANRKKRRKGKGPGSGNGKTAGRGHKGNKARSGYRMPTNFSGIPYFRRLPQRGFNNADYRIEYDVVNLSSISHILDVDTIDRNTLIQVGLLRPNSLRFKVLASGDLNKPLTVVADKFSKSAIQKIQAAGGKVLEKKSEAV